MTKLIYKRVLDIFGCYRVLKHYLMNFFLTGSFYSFRTWLFQILSALNSRMRYQNRCPLLLFPFCLAYSYLALLCNSKTLYLFPQVQTFSVTFISAIFPDQLFLAFASIFHFLLPYLRQELSSQLILFPLVLHSDWRDSKKTRHSNLI